MKKLSIIMCILWMGFIFYNSSQTAQESNEKSTKVLNKIKEFKDDTVDMLRKIINGKNTLSLHESIIVDETIIDEEISGDTVTLNSNIDEVNHNDSDLNVELSSSTDNRQVDIHRSDIKDFLIKVKDNVKYFITKHFNNFNVFIRKSAHAFEFLVLSILVSWAMFSHGIKGKKASIYILSIVLFYAATDEFHQLFVPGRGASINDVIIDFIGGIIGLIIFYCGYYGVQHIVRKRKIKLGVRA